MNGSCRQDRPGAVPAAAHQHRVRLLARGAVEIGFLRVRVALVAADVLHIGEARVPDQLERVDVRVVEVGLERRIRVEHPVIAAQRRISRRIRRRGERHVRQSGGRGLRAVVGRGREQAAEVARRDVLRRDLLQRAAALVPLGVCVLEPAFERIADVELELAFGVQVVAHVAFARTAVLVAEETLALAAAAAGSLEAQPVGDRAGDRAVENLRVVVAGDCADLAFPGFSRTLGDHVQRAADRIASVQRALRAAQHFDALGVNRALARFDVARGIEAVGVRRDAGIGAVVVGEAADAAQAHAIERRGIRQAGREVGEIADRGDADQVARGARECGHRNRHVLQALAALLRGDDDFLENARGPARPFLRQCSSC